MGDNQAEIFWDSQDPKAAGWWLRWYVDGSEEGDAIDLERDASARELVDAAIGLVPASKGIKVFLTEDRPLTFDDMCVTESHVRELGAEAQAAGDTESFAICERANNGNAEAFAACVEEIRRSRLGR